MVVECVVQIDLDVLVQERGEDLVHVALETGRGIGKPKGHDFESKWSERCHEGHFPFIARSDSDLIIA